jgi:hypothetical protein
LCLLAFASDILTATLFPHFIHFIFLDFSSSMLYQLCMLLVLDEDDAMFIIILYYGCVDYRITVNMKKELLRCYLWVMVKIDCENWLCFFNGKGNVEFCQVWQVYLMEFWWKEGRIYCLVMHARMWWKIVASYDLWYFHN